MTLPLGVWGSSETKWNFFGILNLARLWDKNSDNSSGFIYPGHVTRFVPAVHKGFLGGARVV